MKLNLEYIGNSTWKVITNTKLIGAAELRFKRSGDYYEISYREITSDIIIPISSCREVSKVLDIISFLNELTSEEGGKCTD